MLRIRIYLHNFTRRTNTSFLYIDSLRTIELVPRRLKTQNISNLRFSTIIHIKQIIIHNYIFIDFSYDF